MFFCVGSLLLVPLYLMAHPSGSTMASGFTTPGPAGQCWPAPERAAWPR